MDLIDGIRGVQGSSFCPVRHPFPVIPIVGGVPNTGPCFGRCFPMPGIGVALIGTVSVFPGDDVIFVYGAMADPRDKPLPNTRAVTSYRQRMGFEVPRVEFSNYRDFFGIGSPYGKKGT